MNHLTISTPLGDMRAFADEHGLTGLYFTDQSNLPDTSASTADASHPILQQAQQQLDEYFCGKRRQFTISLAAKGTAFQHKVGMR